MPQRDRDKNLPTLAVELKDLVVAYAKQETVEPMKNLGRFVGYGVAGSFVLAAGVLLLVLGLLRGLQELSAFDGDWDFAPYLITLVACAVVAGLSARAIGAAKRRRSDR